MAFGHHLTTGDGGAPINFHRRRWRRGLLGRRRRRRQQQSVSLCNAAKLAVTLSKISYAEKFTINACVRILSRALGRPLGSVFDTMCLSVVVVYDA